MISKKEQEGGGKHLHLHIHLPLHELAPLCEGIDEFSWVVGAQIDPQVHAVGPFYHT